MFAAVIIITILSFALIQAVLLNRKLETKIAHDDVNEILFSGNERRAIKHSVQLFDEWYTHHKQEFADVTLVELRPIKHYLSKVEWRIDNTNLQPLE